jgi:hypothetical protein
MSQDIPRFFQAKLKLQWADKHISELQSAWNAFIQTDFCKLVVKDQPDGSQELHVVSMEGLWPDFPLLLGDCVHNLRCSLDHAVNEVLGWKDTRLSFPMSESREELEDSFRTEPEVIAGRTKGKGRNAAIELAVGGIAEFFLDTVRPYKGADNPLWVLNRLSQRDKHRLLLPVLSVHTVSGISAVDNRGNRFANISGSINAGGVCNMISVGNGGLKIESYGKPSAEILLNERGVIEKASLFPALIQMRQVCHETIGGLDTFLTTIGWTPPNPS